MGQIFGREQQEMQGQKPNEPFIDTSRNTVGTMIQTPFIDASSEVNTLVDELKQAIHKNANSDSTALLFKHEVLEMKRAARAHDVMFEEEEANAQVKGKKTRRQTLQEFILLFFYCAYAILSAAVIMYAYIEKGSSNALSVTGIMVVIAFVITGLIIRLA
jgi:hypothetical protein